jgi:predicted phosphodiesterase
MKEFKKAVVQVADEMGIKPQYVTSKDFKNISDFSEWELRKIGGFSAAHAFLYPETKVDGVQAMATKAKAAWLKKGIKKQVNDEYLNLEFLETFKEIMKDNPLKVHAPYKPIKKTKNKERAIVVHVSDTHFGANIEASEMHGFNEFNWSIAARRMALLAEQVISYKAQYRDSTELVIAINGDIIAGVIHDQEWFSDLLSKQTAGTIKILVQFISLCAQHFDSVRVVMTTGNHGRSMHKMGKSRATTHKWDSYETNIYLGVKAAIQAKCSNVKCEIPETPYAIVNILGHNFFITHGDTVVNAGNPGSSLNMKSLNNQINTLIASFKMKFAGVMLGHTHVSTVQTLASKTKLLVNGTLSGADPYCQSLGIMSNNPEQTIFEVTRSHAVGDIRFIDLLAADDRPELEKLIEPLKGNLE